MCSSVDHFIMIVCVLLLAWCFFPFTAPAGFDQFDEYVECKPHYKKIALGGNIAKDKAKIIVPPFIKNIDKTKLSKYILKEPSKITENAEALQNLVDFTKTVADVLNGLSVASQVLGVVVPFAGTASLMLAFLSDYRSAEHTKTEMLKEVNSALYTLTAGVNKRFDEMRLYVDESVISLEKSILDGEYKHMYLYLESCLDEYDIGLRQTCMVDKCRYVKSGIPKFAIYMDAIKQKIKPTISMIKRIDANVPLLFTYITSLLP